MSNILKEMITFDKLSHNYKNKEYLYYEKIHSKILICARKTVLVHLNLV